jgi:hypothetical protein
MYVRCNIVIDGIESTLEDVFASDCFLMKLSLFVIHHYVENRIDGVSFSDYVTSVVDRGIGSPSGQIQDYNMGICCFSAMHAALWSKTG